MDIQFGQHHPLENSLVLNHIFQRLSLCDLKSCRLVSRVWRDSSRLAWRSSAVVEIHPYEMGKKMSDFQLFSKKYHLGQAPIQIKDAPFINFHLRIEGSTRFYYLWGSSMKVLKLNSVEFTSRNEFVRTIFSYCQSLEELTLVGIAGFPVAYTEIVKTKPLKTRTVMEKIEWNGVQENKNLKSITLSHNNFDWEADDWTEFLSRLPSLDSLVFVDSLYANSGQFFQSVKTIRDNHPNKLKLKKIDIGRLQSIPPAVLPVLLDTNLHLEHLDLGRFFLRDLGGSVPEILNKHASSLKTVILWGDPENNVSGDVQPQSLLSLREFENLQHVATRYFWRQEFPLTTLLKLAPNLRKVEFWSLSAKYLGVEDLHISATQDIRLICCTDMCLIVPDLTVQDLEHLISWMPNLRKLRIGGLSNEMFSMVCEGWSDLVKLDVVLSEVNDSGLTGLDAEDVAKINRTGPRGVWRPITVRRANIMCLKELETLSLRANPLSRIKRDLGYCAVTFGVELLPQLKHLNIQNFHMKGQAGSFWRNVCARYPWPRDEESMRELAEYN